MFETNSDASLLCQKPSLDLNSTYVCLAGNDLWDLRPRSATPELGAEVVADADHSGAMNPSAYVLIPEQILGPVARKRSRQLCLKASESVGRLATCRRIDRIDRGYERSTGDEIQDGAVGVEKENSERRAAPDVLDKDLIGHERTVFFSKQGARRSRGVCSSLSIRHVSHA